MMFLSEIPNRDFRFALADGTAVWQWHPSIRILDSRNGSIVTIFNVMEGTLAKAPPRPSSGVGAPSSGGSTLRFVKFALALALLPLCAGMSQSAWEIVRSAWLQASADKHTLAYWFAGGAGAFALVAAAVWWPVVVYVFGHEMLHALATWLCLGSVSNFRASASGGSVTSSKTNTLIRLAPYCVPFYVLLATGVYLALDQWWRPLNAQLPYVFGTLGFFYAFHLAFTVWSMRRDQPDLKPDGWIFSLTIIFLANLAVFTLLAGFVLTGDLKYAWPALRTVSVAGWQHSLDNYRLIGGSVHGAYARYATS